MHCAGEDGDLMLKAKSAYHHYKAHTHTHLNTYGTEAPGVDILAFARCVALRRPGPTAEPI